MSGHFPYDGFLPEKSSGVFGAVACLESELNLKRVSGVRKQGLGKDDISEVRAVEMKDKPYAVGLSGRAKHGGVIFLTLICLDAALGFS